MQLDTGIEERDDAPEQDIPPHLACLFDGPIEVGQASDPAELERKFAARLDALLSFYGFDASPDGWRLLACRLAMGHEIAGTRVMEVRAAGALDETAGGRPAGEMWGWRLRLSTLRKGHGSNRSASAALAKEMQAENRERKRQGLDQTDLPSARTIENWFGSASPGAPREIAEGPLLASVLRRMLAAARRL